ncbi:MAG: sialidase family protein [Candidatus Sigynarchaeota archaeon]
MKRRKALIAISVFFLIYIMNVCIFFNLSDIKYKFMKDVPGVIVKISNEQRSYNAFPKVIRTGDISVNPMGALLAVWYSGNAHVDTNSDGQIWGAFSCDDGRTWSPPALVYDDPVLDCRNIGIAKAPNGTIILFFAKVLVQGSSWTWKDFGFIKSSDHGHSWSPFTSLISNTSSIVPGVGNGNGYGDPIMIQGKIYILCYSRPDPPAFPHYSSFLLTSSDNGTTWEYKSKINKNSTIPANEADFLLGNASGSDLIFGFTRTMDTSGDLLHYFESSDHGVSWPVLFSTNIWGQSPDLFQLSDGRYVVAYRARNDQGIYFIGYFTLDAAFPSFSNKRETLTRLVQKCLVKTTYGQGRSDMGYPSIVSVGSGKILVVFYDIDAGGVFSKLIDEKNL